MAKLKVKKACGPGRMSKGKVTVANRGAIAKPFAKRA